MICLDMPFPKKCSIKTHATICKDSEQRTLFRVQGKKVRSEIIEKLKEEGELNPKGTYICERCIKHAEARIVPKRKKDTIVAEMVQKIENGDIEEDDLEMIMKKRIFKSF
ncbi:uncharacterized protein LOC134251837 [Saccostrea cucullata]|uniref:uncharacterized protein LOC134251837 n=1 Tax=Saccostrea cuccullata TaxID=36930 RepID=UPI002ED1159F